LSTLRQLGIIILTLGIGNPILSYFHLLSHAFFKAILFICAGIVIHNIKDYQDIRKIGLGYRNLNFCISIMLIANISLCGLPFLSGFYSKDLIIEIIIIKGKNLFLFIRFIFGTILTVIYSCRLNFLVGLNFLKSESLFFMSEKSNFILIGIIFLLPFSILGGIVISWKIINLNKLIFLPIWIKLRVLVIILFSFITFYFIFIKLNNYKNNIIIWFLRNIWFLPISINVSLTKLNLNLSRFFFKFVEISWSETIIYNFYTNFINNNYIRKFLDYLSYIYIIQIIEIFAILFLIFMIIR